MKPTQGEGKAEITFAEFLKSARKRAGKTARIVAIEAGLQPSNYCRMEYGILHPPQSKAKLDRLADAVAIPPGAGQRERFYDLAAAATNAVPFDIAEIISTDDAIPLMLRTLGKKKLKKQQIEEIIKLIRGKVD